MAQPQSQGEVWGAEPRPVCQGGDDQAGGVPQVLVGVQELSVTDVGIAVVRPGVPAVPELGLPGKRLRVLHLRSSWLGGLCPAGTATHPCLGPFATSQHKDSAKGSWGHAGGEQSLLMPSLVHTHQQRCPAPKEQNDRKSVRQSSERWCSKNSLWYQIPLFGSFWPQRPWHGHQ